MIGLEQMTPAGQENTEPVVMPDDEVLYELGIPSLCSVGARFNITGCSLMTSSRTSQTSGT